jgi:Phage integrase, N-terminal SAM-like domain
VGVVAVALRIRQLASGRAVRGRRPAPPARTCAARGARAAPCSATGKRGKGKRNVNGEGNIRLRSDGRYEGRAYVITTDGREIRKSLYGKTWEEVHEKLTKLQADTMSGKRVASSSQSVAEYLAYWLEEHARHRVRDTTYASYSWLVRMYLVPLFGKKKLTALRPNDIRRGFFQLKQTCQCCAKGKDRAREERAEQLRAQRAGKAPGRTPGKSRALDAAPRPRASAAATWCRTGLSVTGTAYYEPRCRTRCPRTSC